MQNTKKAPNKGVRLLLIVFGGILAVILLAAAALFVIPLTERVDAAPVAGSADWMAMLPDDVPLGELSIPGTHDAGTQYVQLGFFSKCQARSVGQQLEDGFRYLDIRLAVNGDGLGLNHGFCECRTGAAPWSDRLMLEAVLEDCYARKMPGAGIWTASCPPWARPAAGSSSCAGMMTRRGLVRMPVSRSPGRIRTAMMTPQGRFLLRVAPWAA